ncbi:MAG TPA: hypothetical protein VGK74_02490 [Symbiobacteriaceae bacterium]
MTQEYKPFTGEQIAAVRDRLGIAQRMADPTEELGFAEWYAVDMGGALATIEGLQRQLDEARNRLAGRVLVTPSVDIPVPWLRRPLPYHAGLPCIDAWGETKEDAVARLQEAADRVDRQVARMQQKSTIEAAAPSQGREEERP